MDNYVIYTPNWLERSFVVYWEFTVCICIRSAILYNGSKTVDTYVTAVCNLQSRISRTKLTPQQVLALPHVMRMSCGGFPSLILHFPVRLSPPKLQLSNHAQSLRRLANVQFAIHVCDDRISISSDSPAKSQLCQGIYSMRVNNILQLSSSMSGVGDKCEYKRLP